MPVVAAIACAGVPACADAARGIGFVPGATFGNGSAGIADGRDASFLLPFGVSVDRAGRVLVTDIGAQRIRRIAADGTVSTVAGGGDPVAGSYVLGGFRDGVATAARFDHPTRAIEAPDGAIVVSDTRNHCLRRIADGRVTTLAGDASAPGFVDGPASRARFYSPRGLAFSANGDLYVADYGTGVRVVRAGTNAVATLPTPAWIGPHVVDLSIARDDAGEYLYFTNGRRTAEIVLPFGTGTLAQGWSSSDGDAWQTNAHTNLEGDRPAERQLALAALGRHDFAYVDPSVAGIGYVRNQFGARIASDDVADPAGVAALPGGDLVVADPQRRRVAIVRGPERRDYVKPEELPPPVAAGEYRIAYLSNSYIFYDTWWSASIPGRIESRLNAEAAKIGLRGTARVVPVRFGTLPSMDDYVANVIGGELAGLVVIQVDANFAYEDSGVPYWSDLATTAATWRPPFLTTMRAMLATLAANHVPVALVVQPVAPETGDVDYLAGFEEDGGAGRYDEFDWRESYAALRAAVTELDVPCTIDLGPDLIRAEGASQPPFLSRDFHLSAAGIDVASDALARGLERCAPWRTGRAP